MISEQMEIDDNVQSETILTHISDHLLQGFNISLVVSKPKCQKNYHYQQEQKLVPGPNLTPHQLQHKEITDQVPFADEKSLKSILLDKKFEDAMIYFQKENYQKCVMQLESIKMQINFHLASGKMTFIRRKHTLILAIQIHYYASQCWKQLGDLPKAVDRLEECLKHYVINEPEVLSKLTFELGSLYMVQQKYNKALEIFKKLLIFYEQLNWKADQGYVLSHIAFLYCLYGLSDEAKRIGTEALDICKSVLPATDNVTRQVYFYLGYIYFINKELDYAQEYLELALPRQADDKSQLHINVLNLLAMVSHMRGLEIQSVRMYQKALDITSEKNRSKLLNNLGLVFMDQGRMGKAKQMFTRAHDLIKNQLHMASSKAKKNINFLLTHIL